MTDHVLTNTELVVITLSQNDSPSSLVERSSVFEHLFGRRTERPLADTRLEALRRYAILRRVLEMHSAKLSINGCARWAMMIGE